MGLFRICELDMDGRHFRCYHGVFRASTKKEAREIAAKYYNNNDIVKTGFYYAERVTKQQLDKEKKVLVNKLKKQTKIIM